MKYKIIIEIIAFIFSDDVEKSKNINIGCIISGADNKCNQNDTSEWYVCLLVSILSQYIAKINVNKPNTNTIKVIDSSFGFNILIKKDNIKIPINKALEATVIGTLNLL